MAKSGDVYNKENVKSGSRNVNQMRDNIVEKLLAEVLLTMGKSQWRKAIKLLNNDDIVNNGVDIF